MNLDVYIFLRFVTIFFRFFYVAFCVYCPRSIRMPRPIRLSAYRVSGQVRDFEPCGDGGVLNQDKVIRNNSNWHGTRMCNKETTPFPVEMCTPGCLLDHVCLLMMKRHA